MKANKGMWKRIGNGKRKMKNKISVFKWGIIVILSVLIIPSIICSLFVLPIELIALNFDSYSGLIENKQYIEQMPPVIADVVVDNIILVGDTPTILSDKQNFKSVLANYLPEKWVKDVLLQLIRNTLDYFNFKTPYTSIEIEIEALKDSLVSNSMSIADDYISTLETCTTQQNANAEKTDDIYELDQCEPEDSVREKISLIISTYIGNRGKKLPGSLNVVGLIPSSMVLGERNFYWYNILRWLFRLLPSTTIIMLIIIASLMREDRKRMRGWIGWLLVSIPGLLLFAMVIILIGLDQFLGMILNHPFSQLVAGFGNILLGLTNQITRKILLWVIAESGLVFLFGLILVLASKYTKNKNYATSENLSEVVDVTEEKVEKSIKPQTIEEIEEEETKTETTN